MKFNLCYNVHEAEIDYIEDNKQKPNKVHFSIKKCSAMNFEKQIYIYKDLSWFEFIVLKPGPAYRVDPGPGWPEAATRPSLRKNKKS
jgi:hypothetical protein